ncbi:MAG: DUF2282 domain-containing protein [Rhodospirillaceae bacterium]|nr:DUF2282 domain-containing protein [Rhodospirillaceae bacterium]
MLNTKIMPSILTAAVAGAAYVAISAAPAAAQDKPKYEKCYGIAKAGENSCAAANGAHGCAGQAKADYDGQEFKDVAAGTCEQMNGQKTAFTGKNPKMKS